MPPTLDQHVTDVAIRTKAIADTRTVLLAGLVGAIGTFRLQSRVYEIIARLWADELPAQPPFPVDDETLVITYMAAAEMACFLKLGWPMPRRILDLYVEFRAITNGYQLAGGKGKRGLLNALQLYSVPGISKDEKTDMRELVLRGGPWTNVEKTKILNYCQSDVDVLEPLLQRMMPALDATPRRLGQAPLRGRYMAAVAHMEHVGVPIDTDTFDLIRGNWTILKLDLVGEVDPAFGVYDGATFKRDRFAQMLAGRGIRWPYSDTGTPKLDQDTFRDMCKLRPELEPLRELRHALSELRLEKLRVGADGRNRAPLFPLGTRTGRNAPSNVEFVFGPAVWLRSLVKPRPGRAIAYIDWSAQEIGIAAALSGDEILIGAVQTGDPYLTFAKLAGLAPEDATKHSHRAIRDACKACVLGANYGMQASTLAYRIGRPRADAELLLRSLERTFPVFARWTEQVIDRGTLTGRLSSVFGWPQRFSLVPT